MRQVLWTPSARLDLFEIGVWRGREHPERGETELSVIVTACERLVVFQNLALPFLKLRQTPENWALKGISFFIA